MKRIAFVTNTMTIGGVEKALINLLNSIDYEKYKVVLFLRTRRNNELIEFVNRKVEIKFWGEENTKQNLINSLRGFKVLDVINGVKCRVLLRVSGKDWVINEYYEALTYSLGGQKERFDCVVAFQGLYTGVLATGLYRFESPLKIAWIHGKTAFSEKQVDLLNKMYKKYNHIFCVSEKTKEDYLRSFPDMKQVTDIFYNMFDRENIIRQAEVLIDEKIESIMLTTVGRLAIVKGQMLIPKVVRMLRDSGYNIHWYLIGEGELRPDLEKEIKEYEVEKNVFLLGAKENPYPYIKKCDVYVQPSLSEGYCTTTMEAKILQKIVVTTDVPGMHEQFVSGENGIIVHEATAEALYDGIKKVLDSSQLRQHITKNLEKECCDNSDEIKKLYLLL